MRMHLVAVILNALISLASAGWAGLALHRPEKLSGSPAPQFGERYYARLYALRSLPFELIVATVPAFARGDAVFALVLAAAGVQGADALGGLRLGKRDMAVGASVAAIVHLTCAFALR